MSQHSPYFRALKPEDLPDGHGFDKQATEDDSDAGLVKRGIIENPEEHGKPEDGFVKPDSK